MVCALPRRRVIAGGPSTPLVKSIMSPLSAVTAAKMGNKSVYN